MSSLENYLKVFDIFRNTVNFLRVDSDPIFTAPDNSLNNFPPVHLKQSSAQMSLTKTLHYSLHATMWQNVHINKNIEAQRERNSLSLASDYSLLVAVYLLLSVIKYLIPYLMFDVEEKINGTDAER